MSDDCVYEDEAFAVCLSRHPTALGHTVLSLRNAGSGLFSQNIDDFTAIMSRVPTVSDALRDTYKVQRCALVTEGGNSLSLLPLHGLTKDRKPITSALLEFHDSYPGYITSKAGPAMNDADLTILSSKVQSVSKIEAPFDYAFFGPSSDTNLFAQLVRGEKPQWRIWESDEHVAFLTPYPNTPGFTVLVPRTHLPSDILSLDSAAYLSLSKAAHVVADVLKRAFGISHVGMIFEGMEVDYAHVKLIPIQDPTKARLTSQQESYQETYAGYVSSLPGPQVDPTSLARDCQRLRQDLQQCRVSPPGTWKNPSTHATAILGHPWYGNVMNAFDTLYHASIEFFHRGVEYNHALVPITTDAISSPMGLGFDSLPVPVNFLGRETHLADSMQFALEYFLRIQENTKGVYYINASFRGEDTDRMHLNQFYHVECELPGPLLKGMAVAERYMIHVATDFLTKHPEVILNAAGTTKHVRNLIDLYYCQGERLPQITLDEALALPFMADNPETWHYIVPSDITKGRAVTRTGEVKLLQHFGGAVWLTEMDHLSVPFNQAYADASGKKARCADLLLGNGEVLGLGERHVQAVDVKLALDRHETSAKPYEWYMSMREKKPLLTTGWGMGMERYLAWLLRHDDIRDLAIMPRMKGLEFAP